MGKRLKDNLSSKYVEAANRMTSKGARRRIVAYVESYDDVFFWRSVLSRFEDSTRYFEVMLPTRASHLDRGKKAAVMKLLSGKVGSDMIACVDADYDFLMQGTTQSSKEILDNPYIFHTYAYAIENLQCYAPSLHDVCVAVTLNDHSIFNIEEYLRQFSQAIFPLFVWSIWFHRKSQGNQFPISEFNRVIETGNFGIGRAEDIIQNVRRKCGKKVEQLQRENPDAKQSWKALKEEIKQLGVTADTTYLYIQGHHLYDKVVLPMLKKICDSLVRERQNEINRQSRHNAQRRNELSCYTSSIEPVSAMLKKNLGYERSDPFGRIVEDVRKFLNPEENQT